jgi:sulfur carrier protein
LLSQSVERSFLLQNFLERPFGLFASVSLVIVFYRLGGSLTSAHVLSRLTMNLTVNGEAHRFDTVGDIAGLVAHLGLDIRKVAVERNLEIVPRSAYAATPLADGDRIEIVHFIGGG